MALLGAVTVSVFRTQLDERTAQLRVPAGIRQALQAEAPKLAEAQIPQQIDGEQRRTLQRALDESFVGSFRVTALVAASLALLSALCAVLTIDARTVDRGKTRS